MQSVPQNLSLASSISFSQILLQSQIKLTHIQDDHYFLLINKKHQKALCFGFDSKNYNTSEATLKPINQEDIEQIFQIQKIHQNKYEIVHGNSTLLLTDENEKIKLTFGKWKNNQFFYPQKINNFSEKLQYWIKTEKYSSKYLFYDNNTLKCAIRNPSEDDTVWQIRLCLHNKRLNKSCWIQYVFSNQVIDIPQATDKVDTQLIQYPCNYRFNQRFIIKSEQYGLFSFQSIKTTQFLTVKQGPFSSNVVQQPWKNKPNQLWRIEYVGCSLYKIKSAFEDGMYLVVRDKSTKSDEEIVIGRNQNECLWKIVGNFSLMPNRDQRF